MKEKLTAQQRRALMLAMGWRFRSITKWWSDENGDIVSRKLARAWNEFVKRKDLPYELVEENDQ